MAKKLKFYEAWVIQLIAGQIKRRFPVMEKIRVFLEGKKSYVVAILALVSAGLQVFSGVEIPEYVWVALASLFGITYKAGQNRTEQRLSEFLEKVKGLGDEGKKVYDEFKGSIEIKAEK